MSELLSLSIACLRGGTLHGTADTFRRAREGDLPIRQGRIGEPDAAGAAGAPFDATGLRVLPGFIDVHVHGGGGFDVMDGDPDVLRGMAAFQVRHGVTGFMPTTTTAPKAAIRQAVAAVARAQRSQPAGARILGAHVEGPFLSPRFPGAQNPDFICPPDLAFAQALAQSGAVRLMTVAPEIPEGKALIQALRQWGIVPVMGHTACTYEQAAQGVRWGVRQATHTFNAMRGLHHREPGALGWILQDPTVAAQLIADNVHVHPGAMKILALCKREPGIVLITDAIAAAGQPEGAYDLGGLAVTVRNGACRLADGTLAGSVLTMDKGLAHFMAAAGWPLERAWRASSFNAAASYGGAQAVGSLRPGRWADIALLTDDLEVAGTLVAGRLAYLHPDHRHRLL